MGAISITPPAQGHVDANGNLVAITVKGKVENCQCTGVIVRILCDKNSKEEHYAAPAGSGGTYDWQVKFDLEGEQEQKCACDHMIHVNARCENDPGCQPAEWTGSLLCDRPGRRCPTIGGFDVEVSDECNGDGTRTVEVSATVTQGSETPVVVQWHHDGESGDASAVAGPNTVVQDVFDYPADGQPHTASLEVVSPHGCPPAKFEFGVPKCPSPSVQCPVPVFHDEVISTECVNGKRHVTLAATLTLESAGTLKAKMLIVGPDSNESQLDYKESDVGTVDLVGQGDYAPGAYKLKLEVIEPMGCPHAINEFDVDKCPGPRKCPEMEALDVVGCWPGEVTLTANVTNDTLVQQYEWDFGDGHTQVGGPTVQHHYAARDDDQPYTAKVTIMRPGYCLPRGQSATAGVPKCGNGNGPPPSLCPMWFWLSVALVVGAVVLIVAAGCTGNPVVIGLAVGVAIAALVSFIAWAVVCSGGSCELLVWFINIAIALVPILELLAAVLIALGVPTCGIGAVVSGGYLALVLAVAFYFALYVGCLKRQGELKGNLETVPVTTRKWRAGPDLH